jgi:hypothetical protein
VPDVGDVLKIGFPLFDTANGHVIFTGMKEIEVVTAGGWPNLAATVTCNSVVAGDKLNVSVGQATGDPVVTVLTAVAGTADPEAGEFSVDTGNNECTDSMLLALAEIDGITATHVDAVATIEMVGPYLLEVTADAGDETRLVCVAPDTFTVNTGDAGTFCTSLAHCINNNNFSAVGGAAPMLTAEKLVGSDVVRMETNKLSYVDTDTAASHLTVNFFPDDVYGAGNLTYRSIANFISRINQELRLEAAETWIANQAP